MFENRPKKSHSTLRAKRAMFTFWVEKSQNWSILAIFWKSEARGQTVLPDRSILMDKVWTGWPGKFWILSYTVFETRPKKSHLTLRAKRAMFTFWVDKSYLKKPKNGQFWRILKTWRFWSNSITRPVILGDFQTLWVRLSWVTFLSFEKKSLSFFWKNSGKNSESRT